jgi:hypothetical protein
VYWQNSKKKILGIAEGAVGSCNFKLDEDDLVVQQKAVVVASR